MPENEKTDLAREQKIEANNKAYEQLFDTKANYARLTKSIVQDLINNRKESVLYKKYTKEQVIDFLSKPQNSDKQIRSMSCFLYENSGQYRRICNYFGKLPTYNHLIIPQNLNQFKYNQTIFMANFRKVSAFIERLNIKYHILRIMNICMYQDLYCGLFFETDDSTDFIQINNDYTKITSKIDSCLVYSIDMNYFTTRLYLLDNYGEEIKTAYYNFIGYSYKDESGKKKTVKGNPDLRWFEPSNQICIKVNEDQLLYSLPPFASIFPDILNLEDYKLLKKSGEILDRYKILGFKLPLNDDGSFKLSEPIARKFFNQASNNVDETIGMILSPMEMEKFDFDNSTTSQSNAVAEAESSLFASVGSDKVLLGGGDKTSSTSLKVTVVNDFSISFAIVKQVENWMNRYIKRLNLPYDFKVSFLEQSIYNREDIAKLYKEASTYGVAGARSFYVASIGMSQSDVAGLQELENNLGYIENWKPLQSSATQSNKDNGGRPPTDNPTDSTEAGQENDSNDER